MYVCMCVGVYLIKQSASESEKMELFLFNVGVILQVPPSLSSMKYIYGDYLIGIFLNRSQNVEYRYSLKL